MVRLGGAMDPPFTPPPYPTPSYPLGPGVFVPSGSVTIRAEKFLKMGPELPKKTKKKQLNIEGNSHWNTVEVTGQRIQKKKTPNRKCGGAR